MSPLRLAQSACPTKVLERVARERKCPLQVSSEVVWRNLVHELLDDVCRGLSSNLVVKKTPT